MNTVGRPRKWRRGGGLHQVCRRRMHAHPASSPLRTAGDPPSSSRPGRPARPWWRPHFALAAKGVRKGSRAPRSRAAQVASANCFESPSPVGFGPSPSPYQPAGPPRWPPRAGYHSGAIGPTLADNLMQKFRYRKMITSPCELVWTLDLCAGPGHSRAHHKTSMSTYRAAPTLPRLFTSHTPRRGT